MIEYTGIFEYVQFLNEARSEIILSVKEIIDKGHSESDAIKKFRYILNAFEREGMLISKKIERDINKNSVLDKHMIHGRYRKLIRRTVNSCIYADSLPEIDYIVHSAHVSIYGQTFY